MVFLNIICFEFQVSTIMMPSKVSTKRPSFVLSVTAESNDSSPVPSSPPSTGKSSGFFFGIHNQLLNICIVFSNKISFFFFLGGESFEGFGENDTNDQVSGSGGGIDLVLAPHINSTPNNQ